MTARARPSLLALSLLVVGVTAAAPAEASKDFGPLKRLLGRWEGTATGDPGTGTATREYKLVMDGAFIQLSNRSAYPPSEARREGELHQDAGYLSRDEVRRRWVLRQFHSEGFVHQYLDEPGGDGRKLVFVTESMENMPSGWRARLTFAFSSDDEFVETYELSAPGLPFTRYTEIRFRRAGKGKAAPPAPPKKRR